MMINVESLSVEYIMPNDKSKSIKEFVVSFLSRKIKYNKFNALNEVSFNVKKGEVLGIIGHNGAGKSTLLKVLSGIIKPTKGKVTLNGRIVPLLELGSGFDVDLTGRENIFLNGAILGYNKKFLQQKEPDIIAFSELQEFIEIPIRNYSSGMMMRLAFSIASIVEPEILIVDEILAVGDANFQIKSRDRLMQMMRGGTTVLFVSHSIDQIKEMCDRVLWLNRGQLVKIGETGAICEEYIASLMSGQPIS